MLEFPILKCNKFVYDISYGAGAEAIVNGRQPLASEWADPSVNIPNWRPLDAGETVKAGDVAAYKMSGGGASYSGHTGMMTGSSTNTSAHADAVYPVPNQFSGNPNTTYRRFTGD